MSSCPLSWLMLLSPSSRGLWLILAAFLLVGPGCREVSQPALEEGAERALFPVKQNGRWGYINREGEMVIEPRFDRAYRFAESRALVRRDGLYGYIDPSGTVVIPATYPDAWHFSEGLAPVRMDSLWGFINPQGKMIIDPTFVLAPSRGETRSSSRPRRNDRGVPRDTTTGLVLVPPQFARAQYFSEGRARIRTSEGWGFIDRTGEIVIAPQYARAWDFRNGLARIRTPDGQMGYVTRTGVRVWPPVRSKDENVR